MRLCPPAGCLKSGEGADGKMHSISHIVCSARTFRRSVNKLCQYSAIVNRFQRVPDARRWPEQRSVRDARRALDFCLSINEPTAASQNMKKLILPLGLVFGAQAVMAWFFYRSRVKSQASWTDSDLVVLGLPLVVGFAAAASVLFFSFPQKRLPAILGLSAAGAVISSFVGLLIAFNLYPAGALCFPGGRCKGCRDRNGRRRTSSAPACCPAPPVRCAGS